MAHHGNLVVPVARHLPQRPPRRLGPRHERLHGGLKHTPLALFRPRVPHALQIDLVAELCTQRGLAGPRVARRARDLLQRVEQHDGVELVGAPKGQVARLDGPPERRGHEPGEPGVRRERGAQVGALLLAEGSQVRVAEGFVFHGEVVEALGVADEMDRGRHRGRVSRREVKPG